MSQIQGTNISAPVVPNDSADVFASHFAKYGQGGLRTAETISERDAISVERRENLMQVSVIETAKTYELSVSGWSGLTDSAKLVALANNNNWKTKTSSVPVVDITYSGLSTLISASGLSVGGFYKIIDHQTIHTLNNCAALNVNGTIYEVASGWTNTLSEGVEPLIVQAVTSNALSPLALSPSFPTDIIYYDVSNNFCESPNGTTPRKGKIIYRKDTVNFLETYYDFRKVKFRRWKANPVAWVSGTTYARGASVLGSDGFVYVSKKVGNIGNDPATSAYNVGSGIQQANSEYAFTNNPSWGRIFVPTRSWYVSTSPTSFVAGLSTIPALSTDFRDYYTFNTTSTGTGAIKSISIGYNPIYNNVIFIDATGDGSTFFGNSFESNCTDMTINVKNVNRNKFGIGCVGNIIQGGFTLNSLDAGFSFNFSIMNNGLYIGNSSKNLIGAGCTNNIFSAECSDNVISGLFQNNIMSHTMTANEMRTQVYGTNIGLEFRDNRTQKINTCTFGARVQANTIMGSGFLGGLINATIGDDFMFNQFNYFNGATVGNNVQFNTIMGNQTNIVLPNNFQYNKINGIVGSPTYFEVNTNRNTMNNDFKGGSVSAPLLLKNCVFNTPISGLTTASGTTLDTVVVNVPITNKTIPALTGATISYTSPDGSIWTNGIDNAGHLSPEKIA